MRRLTWLTLIIAACGDGTGEPSPAGSTCPALGAPLTHSGWLKSDETWGGDRPHVITSDLHVPKGMTLTIEPCAEVRIKNGVYFYVEGKLLARGEATRRIRFLRDVEAERFASIWLRSPGSAELAEVDIEGGGGGATTFGATLTVEGNGWPPERPLKVERVTVKHSAGHGIYLSKWAGFAAGSTDLVVQSAGEVQSDRPFPIRIALNAVSTIPEGTYTGNARDEIQLVGEAPHHNVEIDETIRARGVPYHVGGGGMFGLLGVQGSSSPTLTIEPGVTIRFFSSSSNVGGLHIGNTGTNVSGRLVAVGTAAAPIRLEGTGLGSGPGSWEGISFWGTIAQGNRLEHAQIDGAGAHGGDSGFGCPPPGINGTDGAIKLFAEPSEAFIKDSTISNSSSHGIYRAWTGSAFELAAGNTFQNIAGCNQVLPKPPTGPCPMDPPCPK